MWVKRLETLRVGRGWLPSRENRQDREWVSIGWLPDRGNIRDWELG